MAHDPLKKPPHWVQVGDTDVDSDTYDLADKWVASATCPDPADEADVEALALVLQKTINDWFDERFPLPEGAKR